MALICTISVPCLLKQEQERTKHFRPLYAQLIVLFIKILSPQLIKPNYFVIHSTDAAPQFILFIYLETYPLHS